GCRRCCEDLGGSLSSITPRPRSDSTNRIPAFSSARRTRSRVVSCTGSSRSDSRRLRAVSATRAFSASISCVQNSKARAARTCRPVIIHDHLRQTIRAHQKNDYNSRFGRPQCRNLASMPHHPVVHHFLARRLIRTPAQAYLRLLTGGLTPLGRSS